MYCIIVYDIAQKRVNKICKFLRKFLFWTQNSVFEGDIKESDLLKIKNGINKLIKKNDDSIIIYTFERPKWIKREILGIEKGEISQII
ncbi:MAG: CRISPR-associated endonuclease Cas2 [Candidatus Omnitrophica bacterium]|nr:CRISPR-associated endonuclease Cas2 [Candidatus Omnitrophota bacterium]